MQWEVGNSGTLHAYYYRLAVLQIQYNRDCVLSTAWKSQMINLCEAQFV